MELMSAVFNAGWWVCANLLCVLCNIQTFVKIPLYVSAACILYDVVTKSPADACPTDSWGWSTLVP